MGRLCVCVQLAVLFSNLEEKLGTCALWAIWYLCQQTVKLDPRILNFPLFSRPVKTLNILWNWRPTRATLLPLSGLSLWTCSNQKTDLCNCMWLVCEAPWVSIPFALFAFCLCTYSQKQLPDWEKSRELKTGSLQ